MVTAVNYSKSITSGITRVSAGRYGGDTGILLIGDSNMCGAGGGVNPTLDALTNSLYEWDNDTNSIVAISTASAPYFNHTLNDGADEVGPDVPFVDKYATERTATNRVVGLPCGDSSSGFSTAQWFSGEAMYDLAVEIVDEFLAADVDNTIGAILIVLGANDVGDYTKTQWEGHIDNMIDEFRSTAFTGNVTQTSFTNIPVVLCGLAPDWYVGTANRQDMQDSIADTPNRLLRVGYASTTGLASESGDAIHLSGASNRTLGGTNAWTAFIAAEANT